jgi:hypothetical protein
MTHVILQAQKTNDLMKRMKTFPEEEAAGARKKQRKVKASIVSDMMVFSYLPYHTHRG